MTTNEIRALVHDTRAKIIRYGDGYHAPADPLCIAIETLLARQAEVLDRLPEGGVWCYACNRATVPVWGEEPYEHIPAEYKQMKTTFRCPICKRDTSAKDSCVDTIRAILNPENTT